AANATAEPAGHPHEVGVFECLIRSGQRPPPHTEPTRIMSHAEVCVKNDPVHAVVAAAQQILIESAQPIRHGRQVTDTPSPIPNCPAGATFSQLRLRKSVGAYGTYDQRIDGGDVAAGADQWVEVEFAHELGLVGDELGGAADDLAQLCEIDPRQPAIALQQEKGAQLA